VSTGRRGCESVGGSTPDWLEGLRVAGTYALVLNLPRTRTLTVGALGLCDLRAGAYVYVGSALGPGGLRARLKRHFGRIGTRHWHVDYFRRIARVEEVWICRGQSRLEHRWAETLGRAPGLRVPLRRFGSSDCRCQAHLFHAGRRRLRAALSALTGESHRVRG